MFKIDLRDPSPRSGAPQARSLHRVLSDLKVNHPDQWAVIRVFSDPGSAASFVSRIRHRPGTCPHGVFEFTTRALPDGSSEVFAMYVSRAQPTVS